MPDQPMPPGFPIAARPAGLRARVRNRVHVAAWLVAGATWSGTALANPGVTPPPPRPAAPSGEVAPVPSRALQTGALLALLRAPHPEVRQVHLHRIGPDVNAILIEFGTSVPGRGVEPQVRLRALSWLQHFATPATRAVLFELARDRKTDVPARRIALRGLALAFGVEALAVLRDALQDRNLYVREAAAYGLGDIDDRRVAGILGDHLQREPELAVRDAAATSLQRAIAADRRR